MLRTLRQPAQIIPPITFPLMLLAVNVGGLQAATRLPGFPTDNYLNFAIGMAFMQGGLFAMVSSGSDLARDVQTGFLKRLALTPMQRAALLIGQLAGQLVLSLVCSLIYLGVGLAFGMHVEAGVPGVLVVLALAMLMSLGFGALGAFVGLQAGSGEAVQGFFPLFFVLLFLSSTSLPRPLIEQDWFRTIATYNPVSYLVEGIRAPIISGWDGQALALGFGVALAIAVFSLWGASAAVRTRVVRT
jgi:ABC-2 type transport system permease protein